MKSSDTATKSDAQHVFPATLVRCDAMSGSIVQLVSPWLANGQFCMVTALETSLSRFQRDSSRSHHLQRARKNQLQRCSGGARYRQVEKTTSESDIAILARSLAS